MRRNHPCERSKRRGATASKLLFAVLIAVALVIAAVVWLDRPHTPGAAEYSGRAPQAATGPNSSARETPLAVVEPMPRDTSANAPIPALGPNRFEGRGRIRGELLAAPGVVLPTAWSLVVEPNPDLIGAERATTRQVEFSAAEREFDVPDLPLGGYRVRAEAPGLNCFAVSVLLIQGSEDVFATVQLRASGLIDGFVLAANGAPADGLEVVLEAADTLLRTTVVADANGKYLFTNVLDGKYRIYFGHADAPLLPAADLLFVAPTMRFKECTLPPTGALTIYTRTEQGGALGDVEVSGFGVPRGALRARSGFDGAVRASWLLPGEYRLEGLAADQRRGRAHAEVRANETSEVIIHLRDS